MDTDIILIAGIVLGALSIPAMLSAISDGNAPRAPVFMILISGAMIVFAFAMHPGGYAFSDVPDVFFTVIGRYLP